MSKMMVVFEPDKDIELCSFLSQFPKGKRRQLIANLLGGFMDYVGAVNPEFINTYLLMAKGGEYSAERALGIQQATPVATPIVANRTPLKKKAEKKPAERKKVGNKESADKQGASVRKKSTAEEPAVKKEHVRAVNEGGPDPVSDPGNETISVEDALQVPEEKITGNNLFCIKELNGQNKRIY